MPKIADCSSTKGARRDGKRPPTEAALWPLYRCRFQFFRQCFDRLFRLCFQVIQLAVKGDGKPQTLLGFALPRDRHERPILKNIAMEAIDYQYRHCVLPYLNINPVDRNE